MTFCQKRGLGISEILIAMFAISLVGMIAAQYVHNQAQSAQQAQTRTQLSLIHNQASRILQKYESSYWDAELAKPENAELLACFKGQGTDCQANYAASNVFVLPASPEFTAQDNQVLNGFFSSDGVTCAAISSTCFIKRTTIISYQCTELLCKSGLIVSRTEVDSSQMTEEEKHKIVTLTPLESEFPHERMKSMGIMRNLASNCSVADSLSYGTGDFGCVSRPTVNQLFDPGFGFNFKNHSLRFAANSGIFQNGLTTGAGTTGSTTGSTSGNSAGSINGSGAATATTGSTSGNTSGNTAGSTTGNTSGNTSGNTNGSTNGGLGAGSSSSIFSCPANHIPVMQGNGRLICKPVIFSASSSSQGSSSSLPDLHLVPACNAAGLFYIQGLCGPDQATITVSFNGHTASGICNEGVFSVDATPLLIYSLAYTVSLGGLSIPLDCGFYWWNWSSSSASNSESSNSVNCDNENYPNYNSGEPCMCEDPYYDTGDGCALSSSSSSSSSESSWSSSSSEESSYSSEESSSSSESSSVSSEESSASSEESSVSSDESSYSSEETSTSSEETSTSSEEASTSSEETSTSSESASEGYSSTESNASSGSDASTCSIWDSITGSCP